MRYGKDWGGYLEIWKILARRDTGSWERYWDLGEILGSRRDTYELEEILGAIETYWEQEEIISAKRYRQLEEML